MQDSDSLRQEAEKSLKLRKEYVDSIYVSVAVNVLLWGIFLATAPTAFPWPLIVTFITLIVMISETRDYYLSRPERRESAIQKEMARIATLRGSEKPKRDQIVRLSDDGEILYGEDAELTQDSEPAQRAKRQSG